MEMEIYKFINELQERRRQLGMPYRVLAERSNIGINTVQRVMNGKTAGFMDTGFAIANSLGWCITSGKKKNIRALLKQQARRKAQQIIKLAQGTAALEGQGINDKVKKDIENEFVIKLLAGSKVRLWD